MERKNNKAMVANAKSLRKNMTKEERHLWYDFLKGHPARFQRQKVLGRYIVDFYSASAKLVLELDGSQHYEEAGLKYDADRTTFLNNYGLEVVRIPNNEISSNFRGVCAYIDMKIQQHLSEGKQENHDIAVQSLSHFADTK